MRLNASRRAQAHFSLTLRTLPYLRYPRAILASAGMSVDDVPTCRLRARLRQGLEKAVVSCINTSLWHDLQLSTPNCGTLR